MGILANLVASGETVATSVDWSGLISSSSFNGIIEGLNDVLPVVIPFALTVIGIGIVWRFVKKMVKSK